MDCAARGTPQDETHESWRKLMAAADEKGKVKKAPADRCAQVLCRSWVGPHLAAQIRTFEANKTLWESGKKPPN